MAPRIAAYGSWESPLGAGVVARGNVRFSFPTLLDDGTLFFVESRPAESGRNVLVRRTPAGVFTDVTPAPFNVRSRVHEYGGLGHVVQDGRVYFVNFADQQLYVHAVGELPRALTATPAVRYAEPVYDRARGRLLAVAERHPVRGAALASAAAPERGEPENLLVAIEPETGEVSPLASGRSFYAAPAPAPDGKELAFLCWDHPHMPWDAAELWIAGVAADGSLVEPRQLAGGVSGSALQPTWAADGTLYFSLEAGQCWSLHKSDGRSVERVLELDGELGVPLWQLGSRVFACAAGETLVGSSVRQGLAELIRIDPRARHAWLLTRDWLYVRQLDARGTRVVASKGFGTELLEFDLESGQSRVVRSVEQGLLRAEDTSLFEALSFPTGGGERAHGFFYAPRNSRFAAPDGSQPPLIVIAHGGPTGATSPTLNPVVQFWTTRGFAVLDVNYRGSTGYGRAYRERLRGEWGIVDVEDCVAGARQLAEQGRVARDKLAIRGGSAGGYTVLQALANHRVFAAGSCHYGVSDIAALIRDTHKFESHYDRFLVGGKPGQDERLAERSPIHYPERITAPVIFFQGAEDKVVPAGQTRSMADTLRARGVEAEYHEYPGEYHGFHSADTQRHVLDTELAFFRRVLGLG